ncbi:MAG TPA: hypothetical protein VGN55_08460 [Xanthobacteraceae bacterium]|jgi:hypothetical protein
MQTGAENLTGVWQGLYTYSARGRSVSFVATLIESGRVLSGSIHEPRDFGVPVGETLYATLLGSRSGSAVSFTKTYQNAGPFYGSVEYAGALSGDRTEIEGVWTIPRGGSGKFLMVRSAGKTAAIKQKKSVRV